MDFDFTRVVEMEDGEPAKGNGGGISSAMVLMDKVKIQLAEYTATVDLMVGMAKEAEIKDDRTRALAVSLAGDAKRAAKAIEERRKQLVEEPNRWVKGVNNFAKQFTERLERLVEDVIKGKMKTYDARIEMERRKAEEAARRAAEDLQRQLDEEARIANEKSREEAKNKGEDPARVQEIVAPKVETPIVPKADTTVRTESGVTSYALKFWTFEITNEEDIPPEYIIKTVNKRKIQDAVKMGARSIPGLHIFEDSDYRMRT